MQHVIKENSQLTRYQTFVVWIIALLHFTIVLDFMVMAPLNAFLTTAMNLTQEQFSHVVSAYAFSAGIAGFLSAGFADRFDRKKLLLFFYVGFVGGTALCAVAGSYEILLLGRILAGLFGGVVGSISMAIVSDLFPLEVRGRVMGLVQMAFAVSQVFGLPLSLYLAHHMSWHAPFSMIVIFCLFVGLVILLKLEPITAHLKQNKDIPPLKHLYKTFLNPDYFSAFFTTALLSIGGFLLMPFSSKFLVSNVKISEDKLPFLFMITGMCSMIILPIIGRVSDKIGKLKVFSFGSFLAAVMVIIYTNLGPIPFWLMMLINPLLFTGIMSRAIPASALMSAIPASSDRGAFMAITSSLQQIAGGIAAVVGGFIIFQQTPDSPLLSFDILGYLCVGVMMICWFLMVRIDRKLAGK